MLTKGAFLISQKSPYVIFLLCVRFEFSEEKVGCGAKAGQEPCKSRCWNALSPQETSPERSKQVEQSLQTQNGHKIRCAERGLEQKTLVVIDNSLKLHRFFS